MILTKGKLSKEIKETKVAKRLISDGWSEEAKEKPKAKEKEAK